MNNDTVYLLWNFTIALNLIERMSILSYRSIEPFKYGKSSPIL